MLALGDVIQALTTHSKHVPYRNHPLTQLMSDSLGGNAKTLMFVNVSPADYNAKESKESLRWATRVKQVTNRSSKYMETAQVRELKAQLQRLRRQSSAGAVGGSGDTARNKAKLYTRPVPSPTAGGGGKGARGLGGGFGRARQSKS